MGSQRVRHNLVTEQQQQQKPCTIKLWHNLSQGSTLASQELRRLRIRDTWWKTPTSHKHFQWGSQHNHKRRRSGLIIWDEMRGLNGCDRSPQLQLEEQAGATWERRNVARPGGDRQPERAGCTRLRKDRGREKGDAGPACPRGHHWPIWPQ